MAFSSVPTHGKKGNIYWLRPNGFKGSGLNDVTWGAYTESASPDSAHFEVVIDLAAGTDTFKWREDGGSWTEDVTITGAAQSMVGTNGTQVITFAATTGHTLADQWSIGNLYAEATDETDDYAQITDPLKRLLNPNAPPIWTDAGGKAVLTVDNIIGKATFSDTVGAVTVAGDNGYILESGLQKLGYIRNWALNVNCDLAPADRMGQDWHEFEPGMAGATGTIERMFIGTQTLFETIKESIGGTQGFFLLQLFTYDPDQDQSGTHISAWAIINNFGLNASNADLVKSNVSFTVHGIMSTIVANS